MLGICALCDPHGHILTRSASPPGYDLTFPMTAVPLGQLRRECGEWRSDRWYRPLGVAPFLLPAALLQVEWIPEPSAMVLAALGVVATLGFRRRR